MTSILTFISNNYLLFVIISAILLFAIIGYAAERLSSRDIKIKKNKVLENPTMNMSPEEPVEKL